MFCETLEKRFRALKTNKQTDTMKKTTQHIHIANTIGAVAQVIAHKISKPSHN